MRTRVLTVAILSATLLAAGPSAAQQPNPLDAVPEKMPFDIPYGAPISLDRAEAAIAVVDSGGNLVSFKRMDGAQLASIQIAEHKARAAAKFRRETKIFENAIQLSNLNYIITLDDAIASRGGIPLVEGGKLIGAIGCSGGTSSQDEVVCKAGAAVVK